MQTKVASVITFSMPRKIRFDVTLVYVYLHAIEFEVNINQSKVVIKMYVLWRSTNSWHAPLTWLHMRIVIEIVDKKSFDIWQIKRRSDTMSWMAADIFIFFTTCQIFKLKNCKKASCCHLVLVWFESMACTHWNRRVLHQSRKTPILFAFVNVFVFSIQSLSHFLE